MRLVDLARCSLPRPVVERGPGLRRQQGGPDERDEGPPGERAIDQEHLAQIQEVASTSAKIDIVEMLAQ